MAKESKKKFEKPSGHEQQLESTDLFEQYTAGQSAAAKELFDRYVARLIALARSRIGGLKRRVDPEDIVHSAYRSFFIRAGDGEFQVNESGDLWRLLSTITLNKLRKQAERHTASRRDFRRDEEDCTDITQSSQEPTAEEGTALVEQVELIFERLSEIERHALTEFLAGSSVEDIAHMLSKSPRTVRRALQRAKTLAELEILDSANQQTPLEVPPLENPLAYSDFRLERMIGAGGMGKVYRASQLSASRNVAVKALRKDKQTDSRAVRQFLHEASVIAEINHPGIIQVHGLGRFPSGGYFIVMNWIDGVDLQALIDCGPLPYELAKRIIKSVAEAVTHAHSAGVVHCDLKPANILIGRNEQVVVTDFGFAQLLADERPTSAVGGTIGYLAPEVLLAGNRPTPAADVYSLGKLMEKAGLRNHGGMESLIARSISTDATNRPQSAQEFLKEFTQLSSQGDSKTQI